MEELRVALSNNYASNSDEDTYMRSLIEKVVVDAYPSHIEPFIQKAPPWLNFGKCGNTKGMKQRLGMYDSLSPAEELPKPFFMLLKKYGEEQEKKKAAPKTGKPPYQVNIQWFHYFYIQYMLLTDNHGTFEDFLANMELILSFNARLLAVLNGDLFKTNVSSIIQRMKQAVTAIGSFAIKENNLRLNGRYFTKNDKREANTVWRDIMDHSSTTLTYDNVIKYASAERQNIPNLINSLRGAVLEDYKNITIDNGNSSGFNNNDESEKSEDEKEKSDSEDEKEKSDSEDEKEKSDDENGNSDVENDEIAALIEQQAFKEDQVKYRKRELRKTQKRTNNPSRNPETRNEFLHGFVKNRKRTANTLQKNMIKKRTGSFKKKSTVLNAIKRGKETIRKMDENHLLIKVLLKFFDADAVEREIKEHNYTPIKIVKHFIDSNDVTKRRRFWDAIRFEMSSIGSRAFMDLLKESVDSWREIFDIDPAERIPVADPYKFVSCGWTNGR